MQIPQSVATFIIDTNRVNSRGGLPAMNQLEALEKRGDIKLRYTEEIWREHQGANNPKTDAASRKYPAVFHESLDERENEAERKKITDIVFPKGLRDENDKTDVEILRVAKSWNAILVTNDGGSKRQPGGILGAKQKLANIGITIMRDTEAVEHAEREIRSRDAIELRFAVKEGREPASWVRLEKS